MSIQSVRHLLQPVLNIWPLTRLTPVIRRTWTWWLAEICDLPPDSIKQLLAPKHQDLLVSCEEDSFLVQHKCGSTITEIGRLQANGKSGTPLDRPDDIRRTILTLPQDKVLCRDLTLPMATEENLREVLSFEMDKETPFTANQVYYDYLVTGRWPSSKSISLQLFVTPRNVIDNAWATLAGHDIFPDVILPHHEDNHAGHPVNLAPTPRAQRLTQHTVNLSLTALAVTLFVAVLAWPIVQKYLIINTLEEQINIAVKTASASSQLRSEIDILNKGSKYLAEKKQTDMPMIYLLDEISRVIPDNTWVDRIDISKDQLQLQGQSGSAAGLISLIEASPTFHSAQFRSPITQVARTNEERFHLAASLSGEGR